MFNTEQRGRLYYLNSISCSENNAHSLMEWHKVMGHYYPNDIRKLQSVVNGINITNSDECTCEICIRCKMCTFQSRIPDKKAEKPSEFDH